MTQRVISIREAVRADDWLWKFPPLLAVAYAFILVEDHNTFTSLSSLILIFAVCGPAAAAYGYMINDIFDLAADRAAGRKNWMGLFSPFQKFAACLLCLCAGLLPVFFYEFGSTARYLLMVQFLLPTVYSVPPIRFKERGFLGVIVDSLGAHAVPVLFISAAFTYTGSVPQSEAYPLAISAALWSFFLGLRNITIHQVRDRLNDKRANVRTFGGSRKPKKLRKLVLFVFLPCELVSLSVFLAIILQFSWVLAIFVCVFLVTELCRSHFKWTLSLFYPRHNVERYVPFVTNGFYEFWLPLALAIQLTLVNLLYGSILIVHLLIFRRITRESIRWMFLLVEQIKVAVYTRRVKRRIRKVGRILKSPIVFKKS